MIMIYTTAENADTEEEEEAKKATPCNADLDFTETWTLKVADINGHLLCDSARDLYFHN